MTSHRILLAILAMIAGIARANAGAVEIAVFNADVTPPIGAALAGGVITPVESVDDPLSARGIILWPGNGEKPIVLCAVDWIGIANEGQDEWKAMLAEAVGTDPSRTTVHTLHQHDAPVYDPTTEKLLAEHGLSGTMYTPAAAKAAIERTAAAVREAVKTRTPVTHIGVGEVEVHEFASNRRVMGTDGKVKAVRWSATVDAAVRAEPVGLIDPMVKVISLWNGDAPVAVLSYYATHPQSHYGKGRVSCDTVGLARAEREKALPGVPHIHFDGAGGNVTAGKWNDGAPENRPVLVQKLTDGMKRAWEATKKSALTSADIAWTVHPALLPPREEVTAKEQWPVLKDTNAPWRDRLRAAEELAWLSRAPTPIPLTALKLGPVRLLHLPGESFVEYQLAAQAMMPEATVCVAAYGDYGMGYIGTEKSYGEGGYETQVYTSRTSPKVEGTLTAAIKELLTKTP